MKLATLAILACCLSTAAAAETLTVFGYVDRVRDGDTIEVQGVAVRLNGIDAPEMSDDNGSRSRATMIDIVNGRQVECQLTGASTYDRMVGSCFLAEGPEAGADIGALLIEQGWALDCPRYSGGRYSGLETEFAQNTQRRAGYCR